MHFALLFVCYLTGVHSHREGSVRWCHRAGVQAKHSDDDDGDDGDDGEDGGDGKDGDDDEDGAYGDDGKDGDDQVGNIFLLRK